MMNSHLWGFLFPEPPAISKIDNIVYFLPRYKILYKLWWSKLTQMLIPKSELRTRGRGWGGGQGLSTWQLRLPGLIKARRFLVIPAIDIRNVCEIWQPNIEPYIYIYISYTFTNTIAWVFSSPLPAKPDTISRLTKSFGFVRNFLRFRMKISRKFGVKDVIIIIYFDGSID